MGTWPNEPRWTVQLYLWIDLSAKNLWHWNFNSNGAAKEWRNGPGSQWISGLLSEFKLPTDSPFGYIHHVASCYIYCNYLNLIYIWSIFVFYMCILFLSMYFMCICASIPNLFMLAFSEISEAQREVWAWCPDLQGVSDLWRYHVFGQSVGSFSSHFAHWFLCKVIWIILVSLCPMIFNYLSELQRLELQSQVASHIRNPRLKSIPRSPALNCQGNLRSSLITCSLTVIRCRPRLSKDTYKH